jgi:capsular exopolysaccharide synthesis family protein
LGGEDPAALPPRAAEFPSEPTGTRPPSAPQEPIHRHARESQITSASDAGRVGTPAADSSPPAPRQLLVDRIDDKLAYKVVVDRDIDPMSREQYRRLAAALHDTQTAGGTKVVLIGSAVAGEGKTLTASNLALTLSESYRRKVLLIDADLRRPLLHTIFAIQGRAGLSEGLASGDAGVPVAQLSEHLCVLTAGSPSPDPMAGLTSERMRQLVSSARASFDWIIVDTPPIGLLPDAGLLASMADGVVLVVKADSTPYEVVKRAVESIGSQRIVGVVLNYATTLSPVSGYGYAYSRTAPGEVLFSG